MGDFEMEDRTEVDTLNRFDKLKTRERKNATSAENLAQQQD